MNRVKLFEEFHEDLSAANEGMMSNIDVIGQEAESKEAFIKEVKEFLSKHAANKDVADNDEFIEGLAKTYFDEEGKKIEVEA